MPAKSVSELRLLTQVSRLYYDEGLKQEEIVERLHLSKSKVLTCPQTMYHLLS